MNDLIFIGCDQVTTDPETIMEQLKPLSNDEKK